MPVLDQLQEAMASGIGDNSYSFQILDIASFETP